MNELAVYLNQVLHFSKDEMEAVLKLFSPKMKLKKGEYLAKEGEYSKKVAFLTEGVMRAFHRNREGVEYNKKFFVHYDLVGAYSALISEEPNAINIECLTDCEIQVADFIKIVKLYDDFPRIERWARKLAEVKFIQKEKREMELVMLSATERYKIFRAEYPDLENRIAQYHIASYLGVTATQLSRIRAKK